MIITISFHIIIIKLLVHSHCHADAVTNDLVHFPSGWFVSHFLRLLAAQKIQYLNLRHFHSGITIIIIFLPPILRTITLLFLNHCLLGNRHDGHTSTPCIHRLLGLKRDREIETEIADKRRQRMARRIYFCNNSFLRPQTIRPIPFTPIYLFPCCPLKAPPDFWLRIALRIESGDKPIYSRIRFVVVVDETSDWPTDKSDD